MSSTSRARVDWYQDDATVSVVLYAAAVQPSSLSVTWRPNILRITYKTTANKDLKSASGGANALITHCLELRLSSGIIDPATLDGGYKFQCSEKKLEMRFRKTTRGHWPTLEISEAPERSGLDSYSKIDNKCIEQELSEDTCPDSEGQFVELLQDIYTKGDDETKRAMMKSFISSKGTILSTDWNQVKGENQ